MQELANRGAETPSSSAHVDGEVSHESAARELGTALARAERRWRLRIVVTLLPAVLVGLLLLLRLTIDLEYLDFIATREESVLAYILLRLFGPVTFSLLLVFLALASMGSLLMMYLQTGFRRANDPRLQSLIALRGGEYQFSSTIQPSTADASPIEASPRNPPVSLRELATAPDVYGLSADKSVSETLNATRARLLRELEALSFRGNLNLTIGIVITTIGIGFLVYFVVYKQSAPSAGEGSMLYLARFLPRLSLVVVIEVFAYFFLGLYKSSLSEIKYFQDELTRLDSRALGLGLLNTISDQPTASAVIFKLTESDRSQRDIPLPQQDSTSVDPRSVIAVAKDLIDLLKPGGK
jgi:hypothetical protein